jgi:hypothetical protein
MGRALLYYLAQTWTADLYRQAQRDKPARGPRARPVIPGHPRPPPGGLAVRRTSDGGCRITSGVLARE